MLLTNYVVSRDPCVYPLSSVSLILESVIEMGNFSKIILFLDIILGFTFLCSFKSTKYEMACVKCTGKKFHFLKGEKNLGKQKLPAIPAHSSQSSSG